MHNGYRQHVHLIFSKQSDDIGNLDCKIQNLIIGISQDQKTFDELKDIVHAENASSKAHISQEFQIVRSRSGSSFERRSADSDMQHREMIATEDSYKRLLESLYFPDIHARQEGIDEAHKNTFEWIFGKSGNEVRPWHPFVDWLENGHGTYWISGKAGSGKSTLMNLLCQDSRTEAALRIWSRANEVFMPNFFFWSPGSQLQKSLAGLLRSLVYQIIKTFPDLMPVLAASIGPSHHGFHQLPTWTEQRLRATLQSLLSAGLQQYRMCIFIDGLDEFQGNHATLLDLIRNLRDITRVKFCLSSRPYSAFRDELGSSPMLKLQDLTEPDIRRYVSDKLEGVPLKASQVAYPSFKIEDAIDTIVWKAEGVFLWVNLAVRDQLEGIRNGDDVEQLQERLQILPIEIEEVYGRMLQGIDKVYRKEVARYIRSALDTEVIIWSLFNFSLAHHKRIDELLLLSPDMIISDMYQHCKSIRERITATCRGFLEVRDTGDHEEWQRMVTAPSDVAGNPARTFSDSLKDRDLSLKQHEELIEMEYLHASTQVEFLHRTAFDFFRDNKQGKEFLRMYASANPHPEILFVKASLARLKVFPLPSDDHEVQRTIATIMHSASVAERITEVAQPALMDLINRSITLLYERSQDQPPDSHWCRVWGPGDEEYLSWEDWTNRRTDELEKDALCRLNFLGLAAWHGHDRYIEHILDSSSKLQTAGTASYLLSCTVGGLQETFISAQHLNLITALLKRGADPNTKVKESTAWSFFLQILHNWYSHNNESFSQSTSCINTVLAFLRNEANVNEKSYCGLSWDFGKQEVVHSEDPPPIVLQHSSIMLHLSARSILQRCLAERPEFSEIENILIASSAYFYEKCVEVVFFVGKGGDGHWISLEPSMEQLSQVAKTLEKHLGGGEEREVLKRQAVELFREFDIPQLLEQKALDEESESESPYEERSQEGQSSNDTDHVSNSSNTNEPSSLNPEDEGPSHSARSSYDQD